MSCPGLVRLKLGQFQSPADFSILCIFSIHMYNFIIFGVLLCKPLHSDSPKSFSAVGDTDWLGWGH